MMLIFVSKSNILIKIVISILDESFKGYNNFIVQGKFKKPDNTKLKK